MLNQIYFSLTFRFLFWCDVSRYVGSEPPKIGMIKCGYNNYFESPTPQIDSWLFWLKRWWLWEWRSSAHIDCQHSRIFKHVGTFKIFVYHHSTVQFNCEVKKMTTSNSTHLAVRAICDNFRVWARVTSPWKRYFCGERLRIELKNNNSHERDFSVAVSNNNDNQVGFWVQLNLY